VDRRVIEYTFGEGVKPLAYFNVKTAQRQNIDQDLKIDETLNRIGFPLTVQSVSERYNRPLPADASEAVLPPPAAPAPVLPNSEPSAAPRETSSLSAAAVEQTLKAQSDLLQDWLARVEKIVAEQNLTDVEMLDAVERMVREMPADLFTKENLAALAGPLEGALGAAAVNALIAATEKGDA
jgi:hypothetical protein